MPQNEKKYLAFHILETMHDMIFIYDTHVFLFFHNFDFVAC